MKSKIDEAVLLAAQWLGIISLIALVGCILSRCGGG